MVNIAIMGHGTVGSGVVEVLKLNEDNIYLRAGQKIRITKILDLREFNDLPYSDLFTKDFNDILNDDSISIVVEAMGGLKPSYEFTKALLKAGKSVVTSNKELVAQKGDKLLAIAKENNVNYLFEASVGGGTPIIRPLHFCLAANQIEYIQGILNGTTNFIMTKMVKDNFSFEQALELAQKKGYAEKDPTADIGGADANRKICILASLAYGKHIYPHEVHQYGINDITLADVEFAKSMGCVIKLIGRASKLENGKVSIMVCPVFLPVSSKLAKIDDVYNAVVVKGNAVGEVLFVGAGAGKMPTASAVMADVIYAVKAENTSISQYWSPSDGMVVSNYRNDIMRFYLRLQVDDVEKAKEFIFEKYESPVILSRINQPDDEIAFKTDFMLEDKVKKLTEELADNGFKQLSKLRIIE